MDRVDVGVVDMGVMSAPARPRDAVLSELRESCRRRAAADELLDVPGAFGVLDGIAPVLFLYGDGPAIGAATLADAAPAVRELYVASEAAGCRADLVAAGWTQTSQFDHVVHVPGDALVVGGVSSAGAVAVAVVRELVAADLTAYVEGLAAATGVAGEVLRAAYPADFFERAAPARLFGVFGADGTLLGGVGVRRQDAGALMFGLWVAPAARGRRLGAQLAAEALAAAYADGASFCHAQVSAGSRRAVAALGMQPCARWVRYERAH